MWNFKSSGVVFFSTILILSIIINIQLEVNATTVFVKSPPIFDVNEPIYIDTLNLPPVRYCLDISTGDAVPDFVAPFSYVYVIPTTNLDSLVNHVVLAGLTPPNINYPRIVGGEGEIIHSSEGEFELFSDLIAAPKNIPSGPLNHAVIFDHCQDGRWTDSEDEIAQSVSKPITLQVNGKAEDINRPSFKKIKNDASLASYEYAKSLSRYKIELALILTAIVASSLALAAAGYPGSVITMLMLSETGVGGAIGGFYIQYLSGWTTGWEYLKQKYEKIANDPPDHNYQSLTSISPLDIPNFNILNVLQSNSIPNIIQYSYDLNTESVLADGLLHSIEKYDGSIFNNDPAWSVIHANEIKEYSMLLKNQLIKSSQTVDNLVESLKKDTVFPNDSEKLEVEILRNHVRQQGWNNSDILHMKNLGLDDNQIKNITSKLLSGEIFTVNQVANDLKNITSINHSMITALDDLIEQVDKIMNDTMTKTSDIFIYDYLPVANAGGPYAGVVNTVISLNGSGFSPVSNITKYEWDLDSDGIFDDSTDQNPQIKYGYPFKGHVGLKVTNQDEWSDINYSYVNITDTNNAPIISQFSPINFNQTVKFDNNILFNMTAFDPDIGDILSIEWQVDNITSMRNSNVFEYSPTFDDIGLHLVQAKVSDSNVSNSTTINTWLVEVVDVDNDLDGWNANVDCNDNNPTVNPGAREIHYNNIDDDCNPNTLDNNTRPSVQNVTFETNQNQRTTIELPSNDIDDDHINFAIVDSPVNGTLGNIVVTKETNYVGRATYTPNNNFHGIDHFTFLANDGKENSSVGRVDINVGITESPIAQSQDIEIDEDSTIKITLEATNSDGHPLTFSIPSFDFNKNQGKTNFGILKDLNQTGPFTAEVTYSPIADYNSDVQNTQDSFVFEVVDGLSVPGFEGREKSGATVSINVKNVNDSPNTVNQYIHTKSNTPIIIDLKGTDVENDATVRDHFNHGLQFSIVEPPSHGILSNINQIIQVNRSPPLLDSTRDQVTYTPQNNFVGKDSFTFITSDGLSSSSFGNITITVQDPNTAIQRTEFEEGDIIIGTSLSGFQWYDSEGNYIKDLQSNLGSWGGTGGAFDSEGNLYVTHFDPFSLTGVSKYSKNGNFIERWHDRNDFGCLPTGTPHTGYECMSPESIVIDKQDNIFVGGVASAEGDESNEVLSPDHRDDIRKFNSDGVLLDSFDVKVEDRGSDWMELDPNQCTMYYTSEDKNILRYDVCDDKQLLNFANTYSVGRILETSQKINYALRLLPTGEFLVASNTEIWKLDSQGSLTQKYDAPGENTWFALNVSPDGKSFWSASLDSPTIYKFDIQTGKILNYFTTYQDGISGIIIKGEPTLSSNDFAPIVFNQTGIINGNVPTLINLTGFDIANDPLTFNIIKGTNSGILSHISHISNNISQVTYTPNPNFDNVDSFTFNANDGKLNSTNTGTITMIRNHAPTANDDNGLATLQGIPISISVLTNDTDVDIGHSVLQDKIRLTKIDTSNTIGKVTINNDNTTINYVPFSPQYIGSDSFNYTISDRYGLIDTAQVSINVLSTNNIPVAASQSLSTMENTAKTIQLVANDADPSDQEKLVYLLTGGPRNGYLPYFNSTTGLAEYKPLKAFHGQDSFTFRVHDGKDRSNIASVNITVADDFVNDRPRVTSERISANVSQPININVLANDIDPNGDFLTLSNFTGPFNGTAFLNHDQTITYQSDPDFNASDVLYYKVADNLGAYGIGQLIIDVKGDAITQTVGVPDSVNVITKKDTPIDIRLVATSLIKRTLNFYISDQPVDGTLSNFVMTADDKANVTYTPNAGFTGDDSFKYVVTDPKSGTMSNIGTIDVIIEDVITNNPPVAKDEQVSVDEDNSIQIQLNATDPDTDSNNNVLTYQITTQSTSGQITDFDKDTGILTYKPNPDFNGPDSFTFKANDNGDPKLDSNVATISITVNPVNDPPVASDQHVQTDKDTSLSIQLQGTDPDNGDSISSYTIVDQPKSGSISLFDSSAGTLTYTPNSDFVGDDSFAFKVVDSNNVESENTGTVFIVVKDGTTPPSDTVPPGYTAPPSSSLCLDAANENTKGTQNDDKLVGTNKKETINGLGGNDSINACSGNDTVNGNSGNDGINGDEGKDKIHGNEGNDYLLGGDGDDEIHGNEGNDILKGGDGDDDLFGNEGDDILTGGPGADKFACGSGNDRITDFNESEGDSKKGDCEVF